MSNPPDQWSKVKLDASPSSESILQQLNGQQSEVTAAFTQQCSDGLYLFLGQYGD